MKGFTIFTLFTSVFVLSSCQCYERKPGCHLDKMHIRGNVVKIEAIVQSTMPLTEIYANAFNPQYGVSTYIGNVAIDFDNNGNAKHSVGYGLDGKKIFDVDIHTTKKAKNDCGIIPVVPIGPGANQNIDNIKTITSKNGDVVSVKYYDGNELVWEQKAFYNEEGSPNSIIKDYAQLSIKTDFQNITYADTTTFNYQEYDNYGNWTVAEINYKGILPRHAHTYKIKRQITYLEDSKKPALIKELAAYNKADITSTNEMDQVSLGRYGTMRIPHYMTLQSQSYINNVNDFNQLHYLFMSVYDNNDAYATISVTSNPGDGSNGFDDMSPKELEYDEDLNQLLEEQYTIVMAQDGTYILKWLPYKFTTVSGYHTLKCRYYRYGKGSPIPVYCENYTIPMADGNTICVTFSFQSNLYNRFYNDFEQSINSIKF